MVYNNVRILNVSFFKFKCAFLNILHRMFENFVLLLQSLLLQSLRLLNRFLWKNVEEKSQLWFIQKNSGSELVCSKDLGYCSPFVYGRARTVKHCSQQVSEQQVLSDGVMTQLEVRITKSFFTLTLNCCFWHIVTRSIDCVNAGKSE